MSTARTASPLPKTGCLRAACYGHSIATAWGAPRGGHARCADSVSARPWCASRGRPGDRCPSARRIEGGCLDGCHRSHYARAAYGVLCECRMGYWRCGCVASGAVGVGAVRCYTVRHHDAMANGKASALSSGQEGHGMNVMTLSREITLSVTSAFPLQ